MIETIWGITFYVYYLKRAIEFYEKALRLTKKYEYSGYSGFQCGAVEIGLIPKEKAEIGENAPPVEFIMDNVDHFCEMLKSRTWTLLNLLMTNIGAAGKQASKILTETY